jgi:hypothetical protein
MEILGSLAKKPSSVAKWPVICLRDEEAMRNPSAGTGSGMFESLALAELAEWSELSERLQRLI